jgi:hypothetical protein
VTKCPALTTGTTNAGAQVGKSLIQVDKNHSIAGGRKLVDPNAQGIPLDACRNPRNPWKS